MDALTNLNALLNAFTASMSDEELLLSSLQSNIAATIASARVAKGLSQKQLANMLHVSQSLVSRWENGDANFTLETLVKIALNLDIEMISPYSPKYSTTLAQKNNDIVYVQVDTETISAAIEKFSPCDATKYKESISIVYGFGG